MKLAEFFSFSPSKEALKLQNDRIGAEIADKLMDLAGEFDGKYEDKIKIINESITNLATRDPELASSIIDSLKERHKYSNKKFLFKINH